MWFSLIVLLTVIVSFVIFVLLAKMFTTYGKTHEIVLPKVEIKLPKREDKEKAKAEKRQEDIKFNIDNFQGYNSPERTVK